MGIGTRLPELYASLRETGLDAANGRLVGGRTGAGGLRPRSAADYRRRPQQRRGHPGAVDRRRTCRAPGEVGLLHPRLRVSVTYAMAEAPRAEVPELVLRRPLEPHRDIGRKRITLIYRPHSAGDSDTIVDNDYKNAIVGATRTGVVVAKADAELEATQRARKEEARGAGVVRSRSS